MLLTVITLCMGNLLVLRVQSTRSYRGGQWKWLPQALQVHTLKFHSFNLLEPFFWGFVNAELWWLKTHHIGNL